MVVWWSGGLVVWWSGDGKMLKICGICEICVPKTA